MSDNTSNNVKLNNNDSSELNIQLRSREEKPKKGTWIEYKLTDETDLMQAKIMNMQPKPNSKDKNYVNIMSQFQITGSINWKYIEHWRELPLGAKQITYEEKSREQPEIHQNQIQRDNDPNMQIKMKKKRKQATPKKAAKKIKSKNQCTNKLQNASRRCSKQTKVVKKNEEHQGMPDSESNADKLEKAVPSEKTSSSPEIHEIATEELHLLKSILTDSESTEKQSLNASIKTCSTAICQSNASDIIADQPIKSEETLRSKQSILSMSLTSINQTPYQETKSLTLPLTASVQTVNSSMNKNEFAEKNEAQNLKITKNTPKYIIGHEPIPARHSKLTNSPNNDLKPKTTNSEYHPMQSNKPSQSHDLQSSILTTQIASLRNKEESPPNQKERSEDVLISEEVTITKNKSLGEKYISSRRYSQNTLAINLDESVKPNISINNSLIEPHANIPKSPTLPFLKANDPTPALPNLTQHFPLPDVLQKDQDISKQMIIASEESVIANAPHSKSNFQSQNSSPPKKSPNENEHTKTTMVKSVTSSINKKLVIQPAKLILTQNENQKATSIFPSSHLTTQPICIKNPSTLNISHLSSENQNHNSVLSEEKRAAINLPAKNPKPDEKQLLNPIETKENHEKSWLRSTVLELSQSTWDLNNISSGSSICNEISSNQRQEAEMPLSSSSESTHQREDLTLNKINHNTEALRPKFTNRYPPKCQIMPPFTTSPIKQTHCNVETPKTFPSKVESPLLLKKPAQRYHSPLTSPNKSPNSPPPDKSMQNNHSKVSYSH